MNVTAQNEYEDAFSEWLSTYSLVTIQRIFDLFNFFPDYSRIKEILKNRNDVYYHFLRVPLRNVFNNIIIGQAEGYREFVQKTFIDFLLSGAANEGGANQGQNIREELEENRLAFMTLADEFDLDYFNHNSLIAESQEALINLARINFRNMKLVQDEDIQELIELVENFESQAKQLTIKFYAYREKFREIIITTQKLFDLVPNYQIDQEQMQIYKEAIDFDLNIGASEQVDT